MTTHIAFLRAINLGPTRKFPKEAIIAACEAAGFDDVATHINTGNVRVVSSLRSRVKAETALEKAFVADRGFEVPTIVFTLKELAEVVADADELGGQMVGLGRHYVSLLKDEPDAGAISAVEAASSDLEVMRVRGRAAHLLMRERDRYHESQFGNAWLEKRLGVATNRNLTVLRQVLAKWGPAAGA